MRADVNVSVRKPGDGLGTRCEIKNVNSVRFVEAAIVYEAKRQVEILEGGGAIRQETRLFDPDKGETRSLRSKEDAHDYRYFPDPDLPPLVLEPDWVEGLRLALPELPGAKRARYQQALGLTPYQAAVLTAEVDTARWFETLLAETAAKAGKPEAEVAKQAANWLISDLFGGLNKLQRGLDQSPISPAQGAELLALMTDGTLSGPLSKQVFEAMLETGEDPGRIVEERGLRQVTDVTAIRAAIDEVLAANPDKLAEYRGGKDKLFGFFVGQAMRATAGKASPAVVNEVLKAALEG